MPEGFSPHLFLIKLARFWVHFHLGRCYSLSFNRLIPLFPSACSSFQSVRRQYLCRSAKTGGLLELLSLPLETSAAEWQDVDTATSGLDLLAVPGSVLSYPEDLLHVCVFEPLHCMCWFGFVCGGGTCVCVNHEHTCACRDPRRMLGVLFHHSPLYFLKTGPLNERGDRLAACKPQWASYHCPPRCWECRDVQPHLAARIPVCAVSSLTQGDNLPGS